MSRERILFNSWIWIKKGEKYEKRNRFGTCGICLRAGTDARILWYWNSIAAKVSADPDYQKELAELGLKPRYMEAEEYTQEVHGIFKTIQDILK